ncbi:MAG: hypothetical protein AAF570_04550 [Bacteroidota bacterium]
MLVATLFFGLTLKAQVTNIGGLLNNTMTPVTGFAGATNSLNVASAAGLSVGDTVLIIQMKGATINETNSANFGNITDIGSAGNYEFAQICDIAGTTLTFDFQLLNNYDPNGFTQIIRVPNYENVNVNSILTEQRWNVNNGVGGVLVFAARGYVQLSADIEMTGDGFWGGWDLNTYTPTCDCGCAPGDPQFANYYYATGNCRSACKGEGIADSIPTKEFGRGKQANGGGGGNDHNAGGGGGANYGAGGIGGNTNNPSCFFGGYCRGANPGVGGLGLGPTYYSIAQNRIFAGGGGGSGHDNNTTGTRGVAGGGIIIILADSIDGAGRTIASNGLSVLAPAQGDGSGGGGAGGTIVMDVRAYSGNGLTLEASGGRGGNNSWGGSNTNCKGPGGGGGGGLLWSRNGGFPGSVATDVTGGASGSNIGATCNGNSMGAQASPGGLMERCCIVISAAYVWAGAALAH